MSNDKMREEFEAWLGIKPCGAAHDLAWAAWKAARAQHVDAIDTLSERVEKHCENRHDCQHAGEAVAWRVWRGDAYELFFNKASAVHRGNCFVPTRSPEPLYTAPPAQVLDGWQLVPNDPDDFMCQMGHQKAWEYIPSLFSEDDANRVYRAMLAATPQPKGGE